MRLDNGASALGCERSRFVGRIILTDRPTGFKPSPPRRAIAFSASLRALGLGRGVAMLGESRTLREKRWPRTWGSVRIRSCPAAKAGGSQ